jgi:hypothetical protein
MRSRRAELGSWALCAALLLAAAAAAAQDAVEPVHIEFHAPSGCPGEAAFLAQVHARTSKVRGAAAGERARTFTITVTRRASGILGQLKIEDPPAPPALREVSGEDCGEIVSALALITALAVDPHASTAPQTSLSTTPTPAPVAEPPAAEAPVSAAPAGSPPLPPYAPPPPWLGPIAMPLPALLPPLRSAAAPSRWRLSSGLQIAAISAVAPGIIPGVDGFIDVEQRAASVFSPSFRVSVFWATGGGIRVGPVFSNFYWLAGRLEGCPLQIRPVASVRLSPCGLIDAGRLQAEGGGRVASAIRVRPWVAPGVLGRLRWEIVDPLLVEVEAGAFFPLVRDTFFIEPGIDVHRAPPVGGSLAAGVGVHFF